jgi:hypothetical protein
VSGGVAGRTGTVHRQALALAGFADEHDARLLGQARANPPAAQLIASYTRGGVLDELDDWFGTQYQIKEARGPAEGQ